MGSSLATSSGSDRPQPSSTSSPCVTAKPQLTCDSADKGTMGGERKTSGLLGDNLREALRHRRRVGGPWDCDSAPSAGDHCPGAGASPTLSSPQKEGAGKGCQSPLVTMRITSPGRLRESKPARPPRAVRPGASACPSLGLTFLLSYMNRHWSR